MKLHFLGTCSGTEPMPGMHHCSWVLEINGTNYWFDAGEGCGYSAFLKGIDVLKTRALFISHPHIDHTGGMPHLFFVMHKMRKPLIHNNTLDVYISDLDCLQAAQMLSWETRKPFFNIEGHQVQDGVIFTDGNIRVTAVHNTHMSEDGSNGWHAFSYLIEAEGKRLVYAGDIGQLNEVDAFLEEPCDLLIMETGHHKVKEVCEYALSKDVARLRFNHHGREIINGREAAQKLVSQYAKESGKSIIICHDGMTEEL